MLRGRKVNTWEGLLFWALVAFHLAPVFAAKWFVTLDGPCHLYSARILKEMLLGDAFFADFFHISKFPEPYWTGHALMAFLLLVLPAWVVEKVLYTLAVVGLAWTFRVFVRRVAPQRVWLSIVVMPFLLHYAVRMGFLNFALSVALCFWVWAVLQRGLDRGVYPTAKLAALMLLLYFTHLFTFVLCAAVAVAMASWPLVLQRVDQRISLSRTVVGLTKILAIPGLLTLAYFVTHHSGETTTSHSPISDLLHWAVTGRAWNALGGAGEMEAGTVIAISIFVAAIAAGIIRFMHGGRKLRTTDFWALLALASIGAYLAVPDVVAGGSSTSPRLLLFVMFFVAVWIIVSSLPKWSLIAVAAVVVCADAYHTRIQYTTARALGHELEQYLEVSDRLNDRTVLLPVNYGDNWMHSNFSNYLGVGGPRVVVLDHFTALAVHDPVQWNVDRLPHAAIGNFATSNRPCVQVEGYERYTGIAVDHVLLWKPHAADDDSCAADLRQQLEKGYELVEASAHDDVMLWRAPED